MPISPPSSPWTKKTLPLSHQISMKSAKEMVEASNALSCHDHSSQLLQDLYQQYKEVVNKYSSIPEGEIGHYLAGLFGNFAVICFKLHKIDEGKKAFNQAISWCMMTREKFLSEPEVVLMLATLHFGLGYFLICYDWCKSSSAEEIFKNLKIALAELQVIGKKIIFANYWQDIAIINRQLGKMYLAFGKREEGRLCLFTALDALIEKIPERTKADYDLLLLIYNNLGEEYVRMIDFADGQLILRMNRLARSVLDKNRQWDFDKTDLAELHKDICINGNPTLLHALMQLMTVIEKDHAKPEFPSKIVARFTQELPSTSLYFPRLDKSMHKTSTVDLPSHSSKPAVETLPKEKNISAEEELKRLKDELKMKEAALSAMAEEKKKRDEELKQTNEKLNIVTQQLESLWVSQKLSGKRDQPESVLAFQERLFKIAKPSSEPVPANPRKTEITKLTGKRNQPG